MAEETVEPLKPKLDIELKRRCGDAALLVTSDFELLQHSLIRE